MHSTYYKETGVDSIKLPQNNVIKLLRNNEVYKYLGVLENDMIIEGEIRQKHAKEHKWRTRKVLEVMLNVVK